MLIKNGKKIFDTKQFFKFKSWMESLIYIVPINGLYNKNQQHESICFRLAAQIFTYFKLNGTNFLFQKNKMVVHFAAQI